MQYTCMYTLIHMYIYICIYPEIAKVGFGIAREMERLSGAPAVRKKIHLSPLLARSSPPSDQFLLRVCSGPLCILTVLTYLNSYLYMHVYIYIYIAGATG